MDCDDEIDGVGVDSKSQLAGMNVVTLNVAMQ